jgi:hypothetical protein
VAISVLLPLLVGWTLAFPADREPGVDAAAVVEARVVAERLDVFGQAEESGYAVARLKRGDGVRIRWKEPAPTGWLAIEPPPAAFCWIEEAAVGTLDDGPVEGGTGRTRVRADRAVVRSGNPDARLPGPPLLTLGRGTPVLLVDRPPLTFGSGRGRRWLAIAPPSDRPFFVPADGIGWERPTPTAATAPMPADVVRAEHDESLPGASDPDLRRIDGMLQAIVTGQPVESWRLEGVRAEYEALSKSRPGLEEPLRARLAQVTKYEQSAKAAQRFIAAVSKSRRRDQEVAKVERKMATVAQESRRSYDAVGFVQPSSRRVEGRKVYALIGRQGTAVAYLDIPPGLDPDPLLTHRVGVRGQSRYNGDLRARVIIVRDLEDLEPTR